MAETITATRKVVARKNHNCDWCNFQIPKGEGYEITTLKYEGDIYTWKNHLKCSQLVCELDMEGEEGVTSDDFYEYIREAYSDIMSKEHNDVYESENFVLPSFKEQMDFVYLKMCAGKNI